jgi:hypothetical protein
MDKYSKMLSQSLRNTASMMQTAQNDDPFKPTTIRKASDGG